MKLNSLCILFSATVVLGAVSRNGGCGGRAGTTCPDSGFGNCCSQYGYCGTTVGYCRTGCQSKFGACDNVQPAVPVLKVSTNGKCSKGVTCKGSAYGECCSAHGYCGSGNDYCKTGCQTSFGSCSETLAGEVSTDASCGGEKGITCASSAFGDCCSRNGFCGSTNAYCGTGCQSKFGKCNGQSSSSSIPSSTSSSTSTISSSTSAISSSSPSSTSTDFSLSSTEIASSTTSTESLPITTSLSTSSESNSSRSSASASSTEPASFSTEVASLTSSASSTGVASSTGSTPAPPPCVTGVLQNGGFESGFQSWQMVGVTGAPSVGTSTAQGKADSGNKFFLVSSRPTIESSATIKQLLPGLKAGDVVSCSGKFAGDGLSTAIATMSIDGQQCAGGMTFGSAPWTDIPGSNGQITVLNDSPALTVKVTLFTGGSAAIPMLKVDNLDVQVHCPAERSTSTSIASITATSSSTSIEPSSSSTNVPSSSSSAPAAPTCVSNLVSNGGFDQGGQLAPWTQTIDRPTGSHSLVGGQNPDSYPFHYTYTSKRSTKIILSQKLTGVKAGDVISCKGKFKYIANDVFQYSGASVEIFISSVGIDRGLQWCASATSYGPEGVGGGSVPSAGWLDVKPYPVEGVTVEQDEPLVVVNVYLDAPMEGTETVSVGLDSLAVVAVGDVSLPVCAV